MVVVGVVVVVVVVVGAVAAAAALRLTVELHFRLVSNPLASGQPGFLIPEQEQNKDHALNLCPCTPTKILGQSILLKS